MSTTKFYSDTTNFGKPLLWGTVPKPGESGGKPIGRYLKTHLRCGRTLLPTGLGTCMFPNTLLALPPMMDTALVKCL